MKNKVINFNLHNSNVITLDNLQVKIGKKKNPTILLENINQTFKSGKVYFLVGPSGSGKTTLLKHLNGLTRSNVGNIFVKDYVILSSQKKIKNYKNIRKEIGFVFQFPNNQIFKDTVLKDAMFAPLNFGQNKVQALESAANWLKILGFNEDNFKLSPFELSNGWMRKLCIAGVLAYTPNIIILDEPMAGLDFASKEMMKRIILELKDQGKTIIIVSHDMDLVLELGDEVLIIDNKKLINAHTPYDLFTNNKLLTTTNISVPHVISTIQKLEKQNKVFGKIWASKPKSINDLSTQILALLAKKGVGNV